MTDGLRVILEIGKKRKVVAAAYEFLIRRTAQHAMDHAWEMEDRDLARPR